MEYHPAVAEYLAQSARLSEALQSAKAAMYEDLRVRRAAPTEPDVMPEIDGYGEVKSLFLGEGVAARYTPPELQGLVKAGLDECYAVLEERRNEAAQAAVPDWEDLEAWFSPQGQQDSETSATADDHEDADRQWP